MKFAGLTSYRPMFYWEAILLLDAVSEVRNETIPWRVVKTLSDVTYHIEEETGQEARKTSSEERFPLR